MSCNNDVASILDDLSTLNKTLSFHWKTNQDILNVVEQNYWRFEEEEYNNIYYEIQSNIREIKIVKRGSDLTKAAALRDQDISDETFASCCDVFSNMDLFSMNWSQFYSMLEETVAQV